MITRPSRLQAFLFDLGWWVRGIPVLLLLAGCAKPYKVNVGDCDLARDIKRVCDHQGRDCGTILCAGDVMTFPIEATK